MKLEDGFLCGSEVKICENYFDINNKESAPDQKKMQFLTDSLGDPFGHQGLDVEVGPYFQVSVSDFQPEGAKEGSGKFTVSSEPSFYRKAVRTFFSVFTGISAKGPKVEDPFETGKSLKDFNFIEEIRGCYERIE